MTWTRPCWRQRLPAGAVVGAALAVALLPSLPSEAAGGWRDILERAAEAARSQPYAGEALVVLLDEDRPHLARVHVRHTPSRGLLVEDGDARQLELGDDGGQLLDAEQGWSAPLPAIDFGAGDDFARLEAKYEVTLEGSDRLMDRACTRLAISRREDGALRERLWIDDDSGLLVRRESFEDDAEPVRLAAYLSLDLDARRVAAAVSRADRARLDGEVPASRARRPLPVLARRELAALAESGWAMPDRLPGGYERVGVYAVDAGESQPVQMVYGDGLYVVSLFQDHGTPEWSSLPPGGEQVDGLDFDAYRWPTAMPQRLVWASEGRTWTLVGDAPSDDLLAIAGALAPSGAPGVLERLRRGLARLWAWATPWDQD